MGGLSDLFKKSIEIGQIISYKYFLRSYCKEAIESFLEVYNSEDNIYSRSLHIDELHEFLTIEDSESSEIYELRKVYA